MDNKSEISAELRALGPVLAGLERVSPLTRPDKEYWASLPGTVMGHIHLHTTARTNPAFSLPPHYFEQLPAQLMAHIQATHAAAATQETVAELAEISPLLASLDKKLPFEAPAGYFDQLVFHSPKQATAIPLRWKAQQWFGYAAAAVVAGVMVSAAFLFTDTGSGSSPGSLKHVSVQEDMARLSEEEIVNYLNTTPLPAIETGTLVPDTAPELQNSVNNMSEEEIKEYLLENTNPGEKPVKGI